MSNRKSMIFSISLVSLKKKLLILPKNISFNLYFMKKYLILLLGLLIVFQLLNAEKVPYEKARQAALNFYASRINSEERILKSKLQVFDHFIIEDKSGILYYVFNIHKGFVIVSGNDATKPVPGYSFESSYSPPTRESNFIAWMDQYAEQIRSVNLQNLAPDEQISREWKELLDGDLNHVKSVNNYREIQPMFTSQWDQGVPYNEMCPADPAGPGGRCLTGCVATAMGQLLYYFRWPDSGLGSYSYQHPDYGEISADFENSDYKWNEMTNQCTGSTPEVAEILFHLGVSVDMVYGPAGSGMYNHKAAYSLKTYFKFSPETQYVFRDSTSMDWDSLIISHLDRRIPMYYAGWSVPNINGHAFICDGYQTDEYFHFNWGWSGSYDGYFYLNNLNPGGSNFNLAQELIINAYPDTVNYNYPAYCTENQIVTSFSGSIDDGSGPMYYYQPGSNCSWLIDPQNEMDSVSNITLNFSKFSLADGDFLRVYDGDNTGAELLGEFTGNNLPGSYTSSGNKMLITFSSDGVGESHGFLASWQSLRPVWCNGMTTINEPSGEFSDGSQSFFYNNNSTCMWRIMPQSNSATVLVFDEFKTEALNDVLKIYDLANNQLLATISGEYDSLNLPEPVQSPSGKMFITFTTNASIRNQGWKAHYYNGNVGYDLETENEKSLVAFPNPNSGHFFIQSKGTSPLNLFMSDVMGNHFVVKWKQTDQFIEIDGTGLSAGIYFVNIVSEQKIVRIKVLIVE